MMAVSSRNGVERIEGRARFVDAHTVEVNGETIKAKHIVIATGAHPFIPSVPGAEFGETSDDVFAWEELPTSVAIIGGWLHRGGTSWCAPPLGVQTDLFIRRDRVLRSFDSYIVDGLMEEMEKQNLPLHKHKVPMKLEKLEDGRVKIYFEDMTSHVADHCYLGNRTKTKRPGPQSRSCRCHLK